MKKESSIVNEKTVYDISLLLKNIALVSSITGKSCLVNIKTHEIIGNFDHYRTTYYSGENFYFQEKKVDNSAKEGWNKTDTYVNIYDAEKEKYIFENFKYINGSFDYGIFQNPETQKFHLFDMKTIRNEENIFNVEFDSIETILDQNYGTYTVVEQNGKKGIYNKQESKITTPIEYDDIKKINKQEIVVFEKDGKSYFAFHHVNDGIIESPLFDSIECDCQYHDILYCKINNHIDIYDSNDSHRKLLCEFPMFDEIKCLKISNGANGEKSIFLVKQNEKYGLYGFYDDNGRYDDIAVPTYIEIVEPIYDKIEEEYGNYFLYKDDKVGLYTVYHSGYKYIDCTVEPKYDDIRDVGGTYLLFTKGRCDIVTLDKIDAPHVANCEYVENHSDDVIYKVDGKYGIYIPIEKEINIINVMDNITYKSSFKSQNLYITEKNDKQGIIYNGKELLPPIYESVFIYGVNESKCHSADFYYFKLSNGKNTLAKFSRKDSWSDPELLIQDGEYDDIKFYENIMSLDNGQETALYDYDEKLLKTLAPQSAIQSIKLNKNGKDIVVYNIDEIYYFYKSGNLEPVFMEDYDLYVTSYETNTDSFEVSTFNKIEHDEFCLSIDSQSDEDAEKSLLEMCDDSKSIREKYPTLVLKRINKSNN